MDETEITNTAEIITEDDISKHSFLPEERFVPEKVDRIEIEREDLKHRLLYNVSDQTPIHIAIFSAFQQVLIGLSTSLAVSSFVADVTCASEFPDIKTDLLSTTLLMNGVTTLLIVTIGTSKPEEGCMYVDLSITGEYQHVNRIRIHVSEEIPVFQGACADYVVPLLAIQLVNKDFCKLPDSEDIANGTLTKGNFSQLNATLDDVSRKREHAFTKLQEFQGCLMLVGVIHTLVGMTGTVGFLLRFIGPITVVPTNLLSGIFLSRATVKFCRTHWAIALVTAGTSIILSQYLGEKKMPYPRWSRKRGFYWSWYPFHQVFSILIGILVGWGMSALMTVTGALTDDPNDFQYMARTDARSGIIKDANWFKMPYPNQFGRPSFNAGIFIAFLIATITSILDSIGDYYACARVCNIPPPPRHAVNRGIAVEGFGSTLSGLFGCGHATTTSGGNIGALGVTKVASRDVFWWVSLIYVVFGLVGKVSAIFITIPLPVLGGAMMVMFAMFNGVVLSNLQVVSLSSTRNMAVMGTGLLMGLMVPYWLEAFPEDISTGSPYYDNILKTLLLNPNLCGGVTACILDNTVPGTLEERGITAWQNPEEGDNSVKYSEGLDVYNPLIPAKWMSWRIMKYIPFCRYQPVRSGDINNHIG